MEFMKVKSKIPYCNRNHTGWYIASYLERFEYYDEIKSNLSRRCIAWENTILIRAKNREQAFKKAVSIGRVGDGMEAWNSKGRKGAWRFEGLTSLVPIYDKMKDGSELLWTEYNGRTVKTIKSWVRTKRKLEVFDDRPKSADDIHH
jgi:hypothetical protein